MTETAVESPICDICGAEVRDGSQFCFNCGGSVSKPEDISEMPVAIPKPEPPAGTVEQKSPAANVDHARRRNVRAANRQPLVLVWQQTDGIRVPFIVGALVLVLIAVALFFAANYLH